VPAEIVLGFKDETVVQLLSLDPQREGALALVGLGNAPDHPSKLSPTLQPLSFETTPLSKSEVDYPEIRAMHEASSLESEAETISWRNAIPVPPEAFHPAPISNPGLIPLKPLNDSEIPRDNIESVIQRRGSTRQFARETISFSQLSTLLERATQDIAADFLHPKKASLNDLYLIVNAVEGLAPGAYAFHRQISSLELLKQGDFRRDAGYLGLGQEIPADCSVNVFFLTDLNEVLERFGNRGYRAAQLEASIMGGRLYLAAYAQRLGASGLTFFDDDVTEFFSPHAKGKSVMFLLAVGKSVKQKS
jgi:hypothetical protein